MKDLITLVACYVTNFATLMSTMENQNEWWISLIVSCLSPIAYFLLRYLFNILITKAHKKGDLTDEQAKDLQDKANEITEDKDDESKSK